METGTAELATADGPMPVFEAVPGASEPPARGAVIVFQEAFGVTAHIEDVTRRLASAGFHAVAPHLFHRTGSPALGYDDFSKVMEHMTAIDDEAIMCDTRATLDHLERAGWGHTHVCTVGFCMGGRASFLVGATVSLAAAVTFYGSAIVTGRNEQMVSLLGLVPTMATPWLGLFGDEDQAIPVEDVERLRVELDRSSPVETEIVRYPGAEHGFHCDARPSYAPAAAADAWRRTISWFDEHLHRLAT